MIFKTIDTAFKKWYASIPKNIIHRDGLGVGFIIPRKEGFEAGFSYSIRNINEKWFKGSPFKRP